MERRKTALLILSEYEEQKTFLNLALKNGLSKLGEGRAFVTELVYGVVRYRRFLDEIINRFSTTKVKKLSTPVKNILRMGFYQYHFMDKVPDFAIVNESVKLTAKFAYKSKGLVNAVLRKGLTDAPKDISVAVKESFSDEVYELLHLQYGDQTEQLLSDLNQKVPLALRYNHQRFSSVEEAKTQLDDCERYGDVLLPQKVDNLSMLIENGDFSVQSVSSQWAVRVLDPKKGERILDCCAAPGGKTAYIGELMQNEGELVATELYPHRCELIEKNLSRCGITIATVEEGDASCKTFSEKFDRILADVPCSGLGVIGGKPDIKWRDFGFSDLVALQKQILNNMANALKQGGVMVYSTCTVNRDENERQIEWFLREHPEFSLEPFQMKLGETSYGESGMAQILPNGITIGFFIAKLRKNEIIGCG
ncbi:MAG: 16S rRNA (cytosine(967)-C(5))-methyltransferase RsmB [Ruminococcaceae bacterium]|nr:16S rRNA (cytosine(967)-C(5))-methyltransferase RsmB [Oscillospiraceae bacterium]